MPKVTRDFFARPRGEQEWLLQNTWCDVCAKADLGMTAPAEYEEGGVVFVAGRCARCGSEVRNQIQERDAGRVPDGGHGDAG